MCVAAVAAGLLLSLVCRPGQAASPSVTTVSYSTGSGGSQLKWLPSRPTEEDGVVQAAASEPMAAPPRTPTKAVPRSATPFDDPFGDNKPKAPVAPAAPPESPSSEQSMELLLPGNASPKPTTTGPKPAAEQPKAQEPIQGFSIERQLQVTVAPRIEDCPDPVEILEPIVKKKILEGVTPKPGEFPRWCSMGKDTFVPRSWSPTTFHWTASALCHKPVYFEDLQLERYGHTFGPWLQPVISSGHFFLSVPALPYAMGLYPPNECIYTLGYYRPGSCTPYMLDALPLSVRAIFAEGAVTTGAVFLVP
jgi:hypothetical protein